MTKPTCSINDCDRPQVARSYCNAHYRRWRSHGDPLGGKPSPSVLKATDHPDGTRTCASCAERQPIDQFDKDRTASRGRRAKCKRCRSAQAKTWYAENQQRQMLRQRERFNRNRDAIRVQDQERYVRHKPKRLELAKAGSHKRRTRLRQVEFDPTISVEELRQRYGDFCAYCDIEMSFEPIVNHVYNPARATIEHVVPLSKGGGHTWDNTCLACWECNVRKNARTPYEWRVASEADDATEALRKQDAEGLHLAAPDA